MSHERYCDQIDWDDKYLESTLNEFRDEMLEKLRLKRDEGAKGGFTPEARAVVFECILAHATKSLHAAGQEVDIANLAFMLWYSKLYEDHLRHQRPGG